MFSSNTSSAADANFVEDVFSTWLYTGTGATQTITNGIDLAGKGGLVWVKARSTTGNHRLFDTTRGVNKPVYSNLTNAQATEANTLTAFNANGFTLGSDAGVNQGSQTWASWTFREQPKFFDVATYTGNGAGSQTISHALGSTPGCIIVKRTDTAYNWFVYHRGGQYGQNGYLTLNSTGAENNIGVDLWTPTSTTFQANNTSINLNIAGGTYVAYLFAHNAGGFGLTGTDNVISCGSYTGNGSPTGPVVTLGYEPQWLLVKKATGGAGYDWCVFDNMRGLPVGDSAPVLFPSSSLAESTITPAFALSATGFGIKTDSAYINESGTTYIYIAIRRGPMKVPTDGTKVFAPVAYTGNSTSGRLITSNFPVDLTINSTVRTSINTDKLQVFPRLTGKAYLATSNTTAESSASSILVTGFDNNTAITIGDGSDINSSGSTYVNWMFQRAPGFFDEVCYTGTGSATTFSHNLTVVPELMIMKPRSTTGNWPTYTSFTGNTQLMLLNTTDAAFTNANYWNSTTPTSSVFTLGINSNVNGSGTTYVAYLFATCPGVSKVGSYTGTGTTLQVNCGFTAGARFVLIKRTDSTGDWYVWDTARGIVAGNDSYLLLNSTAAEVTSTDYIDTSSAGFEISSTAPAAINANGGTFIFLAIA